MSKRNHRAAFTLILLAILVIGAGLLIVTNQPKATVAPTPGYTASPSALLYSPGSELSTSTSATAGSASFEFDIVAPALLAQAKADLDKLPPKDKASMAGYSRDQFGPAWTDNCTTTGCRNSCDTRNDILARDLIDKTFNADNCTVLTGVLYDPYTVRRIDFVRGPNSGVIQIDHLVPLGNAWVSGAQALTKAERTNLANDPFNLVAVDGPTNEAKGDRTADEWLPPAPASHCAYIVHQVEIKITYHLWVTRAEHDAMSRVLAAC